MRVYTAQEIQVELEVRGGTPEEQAAALAVVQSAILESRRLGRIAIKKPRTSWLTRHQTCAARSNSPGTPRQEANLSPKEGQEKSRFSVSLSPPLFYLGSSYSKRKEGLRDWLPGNRGVRGD